MNTLYLKNFLIVAFMLMYTSYALAKTSDDTNLKKDIENTTRLIESKQDALKENTTNQKLTNSEIREIKQRINNNQSKLNEFYENITKTQRELTQIKQDLQIEKNLLKNLFATLYMIGEDSPIKIILNNQEFSDNSRNLTYYQKIYEIKKSHIEKIENLAQEKEKLEEDIKDQVENLISLNEELDSDLVKLNLKKSNEELKAQEINQSIKDEKLKLKKYKQDLLDLENKINEQQREIARKKEEEEKRQILLAREKAKKQKESEEIAEKNIKKTFKAQALNGLNNLKGSLDWPLNGKVIKRFGERRSGDIKWNGILISSSKSLPIKAINNGDILYSGYLNGYGNIIIIDHGKNYYSLYGNNTKNLVQTGMRIQKGDIIAFSGNSGNISPNALYFEIRYKAEPQNPLKWLKK